jgi:hypothetical protein
MPRPHSLVCLVACCLPLLSQPESKFELPAEQRTGSIRRIFVLCHSHLDIGFTRPPDEVARDYKENIDEAIRLTRTNADFKWTIESAWMLEEWLRRTSDPVLIAELGGMLRDGRMGLGVAFANMHSGLMGAEEANRLVYLGHKFRKKWGLTSAVAFQNDVPGFTWAYPRVLAASGVKRMVTGLNLFIGGGNTLGVAQNPFYWTGPDGSRVLTYFTYDSYVEGYRWKLGGRFALSELEQSVPRRLAWLEKNGYRYDAYLLMASPGDNASPQGALGILQRIREWNRKHPELPMQMATAEEFFDYVIERYGDKFAQASGDSAGHWELVKLRVPEAAGKMRQVSNMLPVAEAAAAIASLLTRRSYPRFDVSEAWYSLLAFHEHTADAGGGWPGYFSRADADWSNTAHYAAAMNGFSSTEQLLRRSILRIANPGEERALTNPVSGSEEEATVVVFNGLSWSRGGPVTIERLPLSLREGSLAVEDLATGERVPYEDVPGTKRQVLLFADAVPAIGYKTYRIRKAETSGSYNPPPFPTKVTWNSSGWITSIAQGERALTPADSVKPIGRVLVSRGRDDWRADETGPGNVSVQDGPITRRIQAVRAGSVLPLMLITQYRAANYVDLRFDVDLGFANGITGTNTQFAVSLPFQSAKTFVDGAGFVVRDPEDILPGGKAPQFTPIHFVHYGQKSGWGATVANIDAALLRPEGLFLIAAENFASATRDEGLQRLFRTEPRSSPVQTFRFRVAIQGEKPADWKRFGAEANVPLHAVSTAGKPVPPERSFFEISDTRVHLLAFKPSEDTPGLHIIRLQESSGEPVNRVELKSTFKVLKAEASTLTEEPQGVPVDLRNLAFRPWETKTLLVRIDNP